MRQGSWSWFFFCWLLWKCGWGSALQFREKSFKMAVFSDLHFGEAASLDWGPVQDFNSLRVMSFILDSEKPDLVIFLGDLLTANDMSCHNATKYWSEAISATVERNVSWASVFGNHDDMAFEWPMEWFSTGIPGQADIHEYFQVTTRSELMAHDISNAGSCSSEGPKTLWPSVSNYALQIFPHDSRNLSEPSLILYFFDSGGGSYPKIFSLQHASWFQSLSNKLNPKQRIPELAFWHVPTHAYAKIAPHPGFPIEHPCVGSLNLEAVDPQVAELGFMDLILKRNSMKASFVGHNHGLDWCCPVESEGTMYLCFARHTGYGGYGSWTRGARMIEVSEDPFTLRTYVLLEDGTVSSDLSLPILHDT